MIAVETNQTETAKKPAVLFNLLKRILMFLILATVIGWLLHHATDRFQTGTESAGFARGVLHGAMMPMALPNLVVGNDVTIYAAQNTGRTYKLGYTTGVNACGAIFFGLFFWRVNRWKRKQS